MQQELIESLLRKFLFDKKVALLPGFRKVNAKWGYFAVAPEDRSSVEGIMWDGISEADLKIIDEYESCDHKPPPYRREEHRVIVIAEGRSEMAWVYVGNNWFVL